MNMVKIWDLAGAKPLCSCGRGTCEGKDNTVDSAYDVRVCVSVYLRGLIHIVHLVLIALLTAVLPF